ncbi:hypothetical protein BDQ17DRAFT_1425641 [Cyathus striatus]|nr:hypothetical protein BDQ17DRAFT_1425641 [Cyathus striatus]
MPPWSNVSPRMPSPPIKTFTISPTNTLRLPTQSQPKSVAGCIASVPASTAPSMTNIASSPAGSFTLRLHHGKRAIMMVNDVGDKWKREG